jgi:putative ABC transport system permease protein
MFQLVLVNLGRNRLRTALTLASVFVALFLFSSLGAILDTLQAAADSGSRERLAVRHAISLTNFLPGSYKNRILAIPGVRRVCTQTWFGGRIPTEKGRMRQQFAVDDDFWPMYRKDISIVAWSEPQAPVTLPADTDPHLAAYAVERTACVVGADLMKLHGWKVGQTIHLEGTLFRGTWDFTIRGVYHKAPGGTWSDDLILFHNEYLQENGLGGRDLVGVFKADIPDKSQSAAIAKQIDALFENSDNATKSESEQAFGAGFISMFGNVPFALRMIGFAVVFTILVISANTMVMSVRERTSEVAVLKTLGFTDGAVFGMIVTEAAIITTGGGLAGALAAKFLLVRVPNVPIFNSLTITWATVGAAIAIAVGLGVISGFIPAWQASRLRIVDALRRVD